MNRSWLAFRFFNVVSFAYNSSLANVNSVGPPTRLPQTFGDGNEKTTMGMFNSILADICCSSRHEVGRDTEIQIKWQFPASRALGAYRLGDVIDDIQPEYDNTWIRTDYICSVCSKHSIAKNGIRHIKTNDQQRHPVFIRVEQGKICEILTEPEFEKMGVAAFVHDS